MQKAGLEIRDFGNDRAIGDLVELFQVLSEDYRDKHISVLVTGARSGLSQVFFFGISEDGIPYESYGVLRGVEDLSKELLVAMETRGAVTVVGGGFSS